MLEVTVAVQPAGGLITSGDDHVRVEFPEGAVAKPIQVRLQQGVLPRIQDVPDVAVPFRLTAGDQDGLPVSSFAKPLTITVRYTAEDERRITAGLAPGYRLGLFYFDPVGGTWVVLPGSHDPSSRTITVNTDHFTDYGILATWCPKPPNVLTNGCFDSSLTGWSVAAGSGGTNPTFDAGDGLPAGSVVLPGYANEYIKQTLNNTAITTTGFFTLGFNIATTSPSEQVSLKLLAGSEVYGSVDAVGETGWVTKTASVALTTSGRWYNVKLQTLSSLHSAMHADNVVLTYDRPIPHFDSGLITNGGFEGGPDGWTRQAAGGKPTPSYNGTEGLPPGSHNLLGWSGEYIWQTVPITRSGYYTFSVAAKSSVTTETVRLTVVYNGGANTVTYGDFDTTTEWVTRTITVPLSAGSYDFRIKTQTGGGTPILIDNAAVFYAGPYFDGGLLANGGLESSAAGWETVAGGGHPAPAYDPNVGNPAGSLKLEGWAGEYVSQTFTVTVPGRYRATLDLRGEDPGPGVHVDVLDQSGQAISGFDAPVATGSTWAARSQILDLATGNYSLRVTTIADGSAIWLDNVGLPVAGDLFVGGYLGPGTNPRGLVAAWTSASNWERAHNGDFTGYVRQIIRSPSGVFLAMTSSGHLYRSPDARNWTQIWVGSATSGQMVQLAVAKSGTIFAAMTTDSFNTQNSGVYRSTDDGSTWTQIFQPPDGGYGYRWRGVGITISPIDDSLLWYVGARGYVARGSDRVFLSTDGGASWTTVREAWSAAGTGGPGMQQVVPDPADRGTGYLVVANEISKTTGFGSTWTRIASFSGGSSRSYQNLVVDPLDPAAMWSVTTENGKKNGLYRTTDGGATWSFKAVTVAPNTGDVVSIARSAGGALYAGIDNTAGNKPNIYRSLDDGETWQDVSGDMVGDPAVSEYSIGTWVPMRVLTIYSSADDYKWLHNLGGCPWGGRCAGGVNPVTGNFSQGETDLALPGVGPSISVQRTYNSQDPQSTLFGYGWSSPFARRVITAADGSVTVVNEDGRRDRYTLQNGAYTTDAGANATLTKAQGGAAMAGLSLTQEDGYVLTRPDQTTYHFDQSGKLTSIADRDGNTQTLSYTGDSLTSVTDASGHSVTLSYNAQDYVSQVADPLGRTVSYAYDTIGNQTVVTGTTGLATTYSYVPGTHLLSTVTDANDHPQVSNTYAANGRVAAQTDAAAGSQQLQYNSVSGRTVFTNALGFTNVVTSDSALRLMALQDGLGNATSYTYNANNDRTSVKDGRGNTTYYDYAGMGKVSAITDTLGNTSQLFYDSTYNITRTVDTLGRVADFAYDGQGHLITATTYLTDTDPWTPMVNTFAYDARGLVTCHTDPEGYVTQFGYDLQGNLTIVTDTLGYVTTFGYDTVGRRTSRVEPNGHRTDYAYDQADRPTFITETLESGVQLVTRYEYDGVGNRTKMVDPAGLETHYDYDPRNLLLDEWQVKDGLELRRTSYGYDALGQQTVITDALGFTTRSEYDAAGRVITTTDALNNQTVFGYDANGNRDRLTDARGFLTTFEYDPLNRLTAVYEPLESTTR